MLQHSRVICGIKPREDYACTLPIDEVLSPYVDLVQISVNEVETGVEVPIDRISISSDIVNYGFPYTPDCRTLGQPMEVHSGMNEIDKTGIMSTYPLRPTKWTGVQVELKTNKNVEFCVDIRLLSKESTRMRDDEFDVVRQFAEADAKREKQDSTPQASRTTTLDGSVYVTQSFPPIIENEMHAEAKALAAKMPTKKHATQLDFDRMVLKGNLCCGQTSFPYHELAKLYDSEFITCTPPEEWQVEFAERCTGLKYEEIIPYLKFAKADTMGTWTFESRARQQLQSLERVIGSLL